MIVDSGVWIDHFTGRENEPVQVLRRALREGVEVLVLPVILQEVLQGTLDQAQFRRYERLLAPVPLVRGVDTRRCSVAAASLYSRLRWRGVTLPPTDCLIVASAVLGRRPLLTADADFLRIVTIEPRFQLVLPRD